MEIIVLIVWLVFNIIWFGSGIIAFGIMNYTERMMFKQLFIKDFYGKDFKVDYSPRSTLSLFDYLTIFLGPISLIVLLLQQDVRDNFGISFKRGLWTKEEARILFPDSYTYALESLKYSKTDRDTL